MSILINENSKVLVQGITGSHGKYHAEQMLKYGTKIVGGVTPGKGGSECLGLPVFDSVKSAKAATGANVSVIYVPAAFAADSITEAVEAGIEFVVCITEGIPIIDMMRVKQALKNYPDAKLLGPNCPGLISPGACKVGILPAQIHQKGHIGVVSRSGTLTYEAVNQLTKAGLGQSTAVGIGGDPIKGLGFVEILKLFNDDPDTHGVVMIGEIGGRGEEDAAQWIKANMTKPMAAFVSGSAAPSGKRMGHAGAIITGGMGSAAGKISALKDAGVIVAATPDKIGAAMVEALKRK